MLATSKTTASLTIGGPTGLQLPGSLQLSEPVSPVQVLPAGVGALVPMSRRVGAPASPSRMLLPPLVQMISGSMTSTMSVGSSTNVTLSMNVGSQLSA